MADDKSKKRKRLSNGVDTANKRAIVDPSAGSSIAVKHVTGDGLHPVLTFSPGLTAPAISFTAYSKPHTEDTASSERPKPLTHSKLLHSSKHPRLDYTASPRSTNKPLAHYMAAFDPQTGTLQVVPAYHADMHAVLRTELQQQQNAPTRRTTGQQRVALGQEFGTKRAKKAIASRTVNAITKTETPEGKQDDVQNTILEAVAEATGLGQSEHEKLEASLAVKPIPKPNLGASTVEEVYPLKILIPPADMRLVLVKEWQDKARADEEIPLWHRFTATHLVQIAKGDNVDKLKALRYLALLLQFHDALPTGGRTGRKVPKREILNEKLKDYPATLVDNVRRRFSSENNELGKWHMDNLYTHMCALSLYIDDWVSNTTDLKLDLKMDNPTMSRYFIELGCKILPLTDKEREHGKLTKAQAIAMKRAKLVLPLNFPKLRTGGGKR